MARSRNVLIQSSAATRLLLAAPTPVPSYAAGAPPAIQQAQQQQVPRMATHHYPPFLSLTQELLALVASFLEGGYALRTLPLVAAPLADNVDVLIEQVSE